MSTWFEESRVASLGYDTKACFAAVIGSDTLASLKWWRVSGLFVGAGAKSGRMIRTGAEGPRRSTTLIPICAGGHGRAMDLGGGVRLCAERRDLASSQSAGRVNICGAPARAHHLRPPGLTNVSGGAVVPAWGWAWAADWRWTSLGMKTTPMSFRDRSGGG